MKKIIAVIYLCVAVAAPAWCGVPQVTPRFKHVELKEFTSLELNIVPQLGTQLIFPFKLDNPDLDPTLKIELTNGDGFDVPTSEEKIKMLLAGQNTITIIGKYSNQGEQPSYLGTLFISVGGYNLSIALRTTYNVDQLVTNVVFDVSDEKREQMIELAVKRRTEQLEASYKKKEDSLEQQAREDALKHIAIVAQTSPDSTSYKESETVDIGGSRLGLYVDETLSYDDKYLLLKFQVDNRSATDIAVKDIKVYSESGGNESYISGKANCPDRINSNDEAKCIYVSTSKLLRTAKKLKLEIFTDKGTGSMTW